MHRVLRVLHFSAFITEWRVERSVLLVSDQFLCVCVCYERVGLLKTRGSVGTSYKLEVLADVRVNAGDSALFSDPVFADLPANILHSPMVTNEHSH